MSCFVFFWNINGILDKGIYGMIFDKNINHFSIWLNTIMWMWVMVTRSINHYTSARKYMMETILKEIENKNLKTS
jgi:hypothetical protein